MRLPVTEGFDKVVYVAEYSSSWILQKTSKGLYIHGYLDGWRRYMDTLVLVVPNLTRVETESPLHSLRRIPNLGQVTALTDETGRAHNDFPSSKFRTKKCHDKYCNKDYKVRSKFMSVVKIQRLTRRCVLRYELLHLNTDWQC